MNTVFLDQGVDAGDEVLYIVMSEGLARKE